jgi:hypothetical protein
MVLRRICGPKREEIIGGSRKLHNYELHKLHSSPNIINTAKSKRMRRAGDVGGSVRRKEIAKKIYP